MTGLLDALTVRKGSARRSLRLITLTAVLGIAAPARAQVLEIRPDGGTETISGPVVTTDSGRADIAPREMAPTPGRPAARAEVVQAIRETSDSLQISDRLIEAVAWQESRLNPTALSPKGARGVMQLMPATAGEQAGKLGLSFSTSALIDDAGFNLQVGGAYFQRLLDYYNGSYPLAVAAYNAGAGNVNKWLRANGDPRVGTIPIQETRNYVQRVMENAVVYEAMYPDKASYNGPNPLSHFLGKPTPG